MGCGEIARYCYDIVVWRDMLSYVNTFLRQDTGTNCIPERENECRVTDTHSANRLIQIRTFCPDEFDAFECFGCEIRDLFPTGQTVKCKCPPHVLDITTVIEFHGFCMEVHSTFEMSDRVNLFIRIPEPCRGHHIVYNVRLQVVRESDPDCCVCAVVTTPDCHDEVVRFFGFVGLCIDHEPFVEFVRIEF